MQTKTYFANNLPAALEVARQELGADALLVDSKPTPPHARKFGRMEVTFAWDPAETAKPQALTRGTTQGTAQARAQLPDSPAAISRGQELDEIRQQLASVRAAVGWPAESPGEKDGLVFERLCDAGLGEETAREAAREIPRTTVGRKGGGRKKGVEKAAPDPQSAVVQALSRRIAVAPFAAMKAGESRTLAFIGPPGRGKTTSLVKVAVALGLARRIPVRIYSAGAHGVGGQEQIARYAAILGTPHQSYESIENLNLALNGDGWKGLALIDTPGISPSDLTEMGEFGRFFSSRPEIEKHLVLRADARSADMLHVISRFAGLQPSRLLFTGLDEALSAGPMVEALIRGGIPATFAGTGQQIPDDLEEVDAAKLARGVWTGGWLESRVEPPPEPRAAVAAA